ncbi:hypothetical protein N8Z01_22360 [Enterobacter hormaechei subsp. hoffmannii]|uniref:hypothetical protein n=1 Tax=Enterobacter cloacae complex TaxID=354276 RepID=UPI00197E5623|nr:MULTISPECIES: hypothetical protein [Enterobacter cloacae complex]MCU2955311.1 hypothetical protein [Enterobacter hormaechei subsp. hoffmannii]MCU3660927.1 hypothetical protein [Enterobacter hormaechei subsp. steigerwaltii]MBK4302991.1 hypothetical protein [Enterobacter hormaechei]MBN6402159.1 hypothetical protein [Enterobacter hormaechei]MCU3566876.1 hypothetical protein [Enterobacter hormaechei subsp. hoffmannii]
MHNSIDSNLNDRSENSEMFEDFIQAIFNDYDSGAINRNQAALAIKCAFVLIENGNASAARRWFKTGRKHIRTIE